MENHEYKNILNKIENFKCFVKVVKDISKNKFVNEEKINMIKNNYYELLISLCTTYMTDNMEELYKQCNKEWVNNIFFNHETKDEYVDDLFYDDTNQILDFLVKNQYFSKNDLLLKKPLKAIEIIRNHLAHYNYNLNGNLISFNDNEDNFKFGSLSFSVESLILLEISILSTNGQSFMKGSYDYLYLTAYEQKNFFIVPEEYRMLKIIKMNDKEDIMPTYLKKSLQTKNNDFLKDKKYENEIEKLRNDLVNNYNSFINNRLIDGFKYEIYELNTDIINRIKSINKDLMKFDKSKKFCTIYSCTIDDIRRSTIAFQKIIHILHLIMDDKVNSIYTVYSDYFKIINNSLYICYMALVFNSVFAYNFDLMQDYIISKHFNVEEGKKISIKFRNSLMHCRYRFNDILDDSNGITIEFWDENKGKKNFECEITKGNSKDMIDNYIKYIKNHIN